MKIGLSQISANYKSMYTNNMKDDKANVSMQISPLNNIDLSEALNF